MSEIAISRVSCGARIVSLTVGCPNGCQGNYAVVPTSVRSVDGTLTDRQRTLALMAAALYEDPPYSCDPVGRRIFAANDAIDRAEIILAEIEKRK